MLYNGIVKEFPVSMTKQKSHLPFKTAWFGVMPFLLFCLAFEIVPILMLLRGSLIEKASGNLTFQNYAGLGTKLFFNSIWNSVKISGLTAFLGVVLGVFIGYAIYCWPSHRFRDSMVTLSDVTTNFAGAPLAFAFVIILGLNGVITQFLLKYFNFNLYPNFSIYSFTGLVLAYVYFQIPLMILLIIPAFSALKKEWFESSQSLGATGFQYWTKIGLPILMPSLIAGFTLLFANAFGAYATAYTLVESQLALVTLQIGYMITGEVRHDPGVGMALAIVSLLIMGISILIYQLATRRAHRWSRQ